MVFLNINTNNYKEKNENGETKIQELNKIITNNTNNKVFIFYYMEGCGPCNNTKPEWAKLKNIFKRLEYDNTVAIVDIDYVLSSKVEDASQEPNRFPTIRFITNKGKTVEDYDESNIENKDDRTIDTFVEWIQPKIRETNKNTDDIDENKNKTKLGGKWSKKYKRTINCKKPRGFSQKQYCKYGRKKTRRNKKKL
jgi:hypothetical protein